MSDKKHTFHDEGDSQVVTEKKVRTKRPSMYRVVLLNDDYTPMEFVVWVLETIFYKPTAEATRLMLDVHQKGKGICGVFTHDVARTKRVQVKAVAEKHQHPLECEIEKV